MPYYDRKFLTSGRAGTRTLNRLLALRRQLDDQIPQRSQEETLLLATWNIRVFDSTAYGERSLEPLHYIAEIIARFDIVAVQEVRRDLSALKRVMKLLGSNWSYLVTDVTAGVAGNKERMAFVYDTRKVTFGGLASEMVLPPVKVKDGRTTQKLVPADQLARTPFVCGFTAGWTNFLLATVHILYGTSKAEDPRRVKEIAQIAKFLKARTLERTAWSQNMIVLGDFNIFNRGDATMKAMTDEGFVIPDELQSVPGSNVPKNKHYDQIAFRVRRDRLATTGQAGVFDYFETLYRDEDESVYGPEIGDAYKITSAGKVRDERSKRSYYRTFWRTYQMSDHLPMWVELRINYTEPYLERLLADVESD